jgi:hypothetical protein
MHLRTGIVLFLQVEAVVLEGDILASRGHLADIYYILKVCNLLLDQIRFVELGD